MRRQRRQGCGRRKEKRNIEMTNRLLFLQPEAGAEAMSIGCFELKHTES